MSPRAKDPQIDCIDWPHCTCPPGTCGHAAQTHPPGLFQSPADAALYISLWIIIAACAGGILWIATAIARALMAALGG